LARCGDEVDRLGAPAQVLGAPESSPRCSRSRPAFLRNKGLPRRPARGRAGRSGLEHGAAAILFAAGILARLKGPVLWCSPPATCSRRRWPGRPAPRPGRLRRDLARRRPPAPDGGGRALARARRRRGRGRALSLAASRRLQLAAEGSGGSRRRDPRWAGMDGRGGCGFRDPLARDGAALGALEHARIGRSRWRVELLRCRGAPAGTDGTRWLLEACDEAGRLGVPARLADGPRPQAAERAAAR
jgi:protein ImuA